MIYVKSKRIFLPTIFLFVFGLGITPIITGSQLNQAIQNANEAYQLSEKTQYYADGEIPSYDIDKRVGIIGTEFYNNINQDKYGRVEQIEGAKGELLIRLKSDVSLYEIAVIANQYNMDILKKYRRNKPSYRLRLSSVTQINTTLDISNLLKSDDKLEQIWRELDADPRVYSVGLNSVGKLADTPWGDPGYWPNDPDVDAKMVDINAPLAWQKLENLGFPPGGSENIWIAVIDDGVDLDHPDLIDNIARDENGNIISASFIGGCEEDLYDCDVINRGGAAGDDDGHGTHVAAVIAEVGDNTLGAAGIAFNTQIVPIRVFETDNETVLRENVIEAIEYAVSEENVRVINMSFGFDDSLIDESEAIENAMAYSNKIFVAAAGNTFNEVIKQFPAAYKGVIAVAAVQMSGKKDPTSIFGDWVDISSYTDIYAAIYDDMYAVRGSTSNAAPVVSGTVALLLSRWPNLTTQEAVDIVVQRANTIYEEDGKSTLGCGVVNAGFSLISTAPIITMSQPDEPLLCKTRFTLGKDIDLSWKPFPANLLEGNVSPDYYTFWWALENGAFYMPESDYGFFKDLGQTLKTSLTSRFIETLWDGTYSWRVAAVYIHNDGAKEVRWTQPQTIKKHTSAGIYDVVTTYDNRASAGCKIKWEPIPGANNYIAKLTADNGVWAYIAYNKPTEMEEPSYTFTDQDIQALHDAAGPNAKWGISIVGTALGSNLSWNDEDDRALMLIPPHDSNPPRFRAFDYYINGDWCQ